MPSQVNITFKPSLERMATAFGNIRTKEFLQKKIEKLAFLIEREAKPVTPYKTGLLRASVRVESIGSLRAVIAPHTHYAIYVHEGTRFMRARPFMLWGTQFALRGFETKVAKDLEVHIGRRLP